MKQTLHSVALVVLGLAVCSSELLAQSDATALFKSKCALCHGEDGSGNTPSGRALKAKDLRAEETQKKSDADIAAVIANGRSKMPAFAQKLKPEQIQQLVGYIHQLAKK